jgi:hypothetical protein
VRLLVDPLICRNLTKKALRSCTFCEIRYAAGQCAAQRAEEGNHVALFSLALPRLDAEKSRAKLHDHQWEIACLRVAVR